MIFDDNAIEGIAKSLDFKNISRYLHKGNFLFNNIELKNRRVLDIGCGKGAWALWGAIKGARYALGIEPELSGSTGGSFAEFKKTITNFNLENVVEAKAISYQNLNVSEPFDVVIMFNVINHLNEEAVVDLHENRINQEIYITELKKIRNLTSNRGILIIADCGRNNFWNYLGMRTPFAPMIDWKIHQNPDTWVNLMNQAGFSPLDLRWSYLAPLYSLTANRFVQWLTLSHFVLRFSAV